MRTVLLLALAGLIPAQVSATAQTHNPSSDRPPNYESMDPGDQLYLVENAVEHEEFFARRGLRYHDPVIQEIVDRVAATVVPTPIDDYVRYRVNLVRDPSPISFSLADGQIYIHTGLLARLQNESQLAAVLAHEAHHVAAHHHIKANRARRSKAKATGVGAFAVDLFIPLSGIVSYLTTSFAHAARTEFTNEMELEADAACMELIENAGHPAAAAMNALERIMQDPELSMPSLLSSWTTYEALSVRRNALQQRLGVSASLAQKSDASERPLLLRQVIEMTIDDYIRLDRAGTAIELADTLIEVQPDAFLFAAKGDAYVALGPRPVRDAEELSQREIKRRKFLTRAELLEEIMETDAGQSNFVANRQLAVDAYEQSLQLDENAARAHRGLAGIYFDHANYRKSGMHYLRYVKLMPDALDRSLVMEKLQHIRKELVIKRETEK